MKENKTPYELGKNLFGKEGRGVVKSGREKFKLNGNPLPFNVLSFWQWSSSDLLNNRLRGILAEYIIASALDLLDTPREEWDAYDLLTKSGLKIEIKSASYLQSWEQDDFSKIVFGIKQTILNGKKARQSDVYIFAVLAHKDKKSIDPLELSQWDFYILKTSVLDEKLKDQKTITLSSLLKLQPKKVKYDEIKSEISRIENL